VGVPVVLLSALVSSLVIYAFLKIDPGVFAGYVAGMEKEIRADYAAGRLTDAARYQYYLKALPGITPSGRAFDIFLRISHLLLCDGYIGDHSAETPAAGIKWFTRGYPAAVFPSTAPTGHSPTNPQRYATTSTTLPPPPAWPSMPA
jgi:hypothetical protein